MAAADPPGQHLVVVGAAAGGVEALRDLVAALPTDFPAALVVVLHIAPAGRASCRRSSPAPATCPPSPRRTPRP